MVSHPTPTEFVPVEDELLSTAIVMALSKAKGWISPNTTVSCTTVSTPMRSMGCFDGKAETTRSMSSSQPTMRS